MIYGLSESICIISTASIIAFNFLLPLSMHAVHLHVFGWWNWWNHRPEQLSKVLRLPRAKLHPSMMTSWSGTRLFFYYQLWPYPKKTVIAFIKAAMFTLTIEGNANRNSLKSVWKLQVIRLKWSKSSALSNNFLEFSGCGRLGLKAPKNRSWSHGVLT